MDNGPREAAEAAGPPDPVAGRSPLLERGGHATS